MQVSTFVCLYVIVMSHSKKQEKGKKNQTEFEAGGVFYLQRVESQFRVSSLRQLGLPLARGGSDPWRRLATEEEPKPASPESQCDSQAFGMFPKCVRAI